MNEDKQEIISDICPFYKEYGSCDKCNTVLDIENEPCYFECMANAIINNNYRKQTEGELREEITTDDFTDLELAKERGWYRKRFYCPNCDLLIKTETWDSKRMFGSGTVLKSNEMPNYCPNCGANIKGGEAE